MIQPLFACLKCCKTVTIYPSIYRSTDATLTS